MKKLFCVMLTLGILLTSTVTAFAATKGDVNSDGNVNSSDALAILQYSVGSNPKNFNKNVADMNDDGKINSSDALAVLRVSVGLDTPSANNEDLVKLYNDSIKKSYNQSVCRLVISTDEAVTVNKLLMDGVENPEMADLFGDIIASTEYEDEKYVFFKGKTLDGQKAEEILSSTEIVPNKVESATSVKYGDGYKLTFNLFSETVSLTDEEDASFPLNVEYCTAEYTDARITAVIDGKGRISNIELSVHINMEMSTSGESVSTTYIDYSADETITYKFSY